MAREIEGYREALAELNLDFAHQRWLKVSQVAEYLGVDNRTVKGMIEKGRLVGYNIGTGEYKIYRIDKHDLAKLIAGGKKNA
jgi:excisionase family DNA binding protein